MTASHWSDALNLSEPLEMHHVGIVVDDIDAAAEAYEKLGFAGSHKEEMTEQKVVAVTLPSGKCWVELIQPTDPEGPIARFLAKRGPGVHHVAYRVTDLSGTIERLQSAGVRMIDETPRIGMHGWHIAFIHPESCMGVLTELVDDRPDPV